MCNILLSVSCHLLYVIFFSPNNLFFVTMSTLLKKLEWLKYILFKKFENDQMSAWQKSIFNNHQNRNLDLRLKKSKIVNWKI